MYMYFNASLNKWYNNNSLMNLFTTMLHIIPGGLEIYVVKISSIVPVSKYAQGLLTLNQCTG